MDRYTRYVLDTIENETGQGFTEEISFAGDYLKWRVKKPRLNSLPKKKRGMVCEFSAASRFRMLSLIAQVDWRRCGTCQFVTLTYPDEYLPPNRDVCGRQRDRFWENFEEQIQKEFACLWRIEWIDRKSGRYVGEIAPHMHMIVFDVPKYTKQQCRKAWRKVISAVGPLEVDVKEMDSPKAVGIYVGKYAAKRTSSILDYDAYPPLWFPGRLWGIHRKNLLSLHEMQTVKLRKEEDVAMLYDYLLSCRSEKNQYGNESFTCIGPSAKAAIHLLTENVLDKDHEVG